MKSRIRKTLVLVGLAGLIAAGVAVGQVGSAVADSPSDPCVGNDAAVEPTDVNPLPDGGGGVRV
jgi:hypothetical protein